MAATGQAIHANGITFNCRIDGREGAPWLVFSNSLATDLTLWDGQAALLGDRFRILRYDTRGHGRTEATAPPYSFDLLTADAVALMDAVGIDRAHWVGPSLGGSTGIAMALNHGDRLLSLAVCDSRSRSDLAFVKAWDDRIAVIDAGGMAAIVEPTIQRWFTPPFLEKGKPVCDRVREMIRNTSREGFTGCSRALQTLDFERRLGELTLPVLFLVGSEDAACPPEAARAMHALVPGSACVIVDPASHISNLENPAQFNAALEAHLARAR
ncbi:MAG: alpha/beta fold hydrolase [Proteobacteria bacterium]|nr:alpha/beta fold hydrolase [Pseudomonadota bacterium]